MPRHNSATVKTDHNNNTNDNKTTSTTTTNTTTIAVNTYITNAI